MVQRGYCKEENLFEHHKNLMLDDGTKVQVPDTGLTYLGEGRYEIKEGVKPHVFPKKEKIF